MTTEKLSKRDVARAVAQERPPVADRWAIPHGQRVNTAIHRAKWPTVPLHRSGNVTPTVPASWLEMLADLAGLPLAMVLAEEVEPTRLHRVAGCRVLAEGIDPASLYLPDWALADWLRDRGYDAEADILMGE